MERPGRHKKNVIGAHHAIARVDGGAFHDGQDVALYALARDVGTMAALPARNLVNFIQKNNS